MSAETRDPFALAGQADGDSELFGLIAEYRRREAFANEHGIDDDEHGIDDDERALRCDAAFVVLGKINNLRPVTLAGVLAALDLAGEIEDPHHWPELAIEGLRAILEREQP